MRKEVVTYVDDMDGEPIPDTQTVHVLTFAVGKTTYTLDTTEEHVEEFNRAIAPFTRAARRSSSVDRVVRLGARRQRRLTDAMAEEPSLSAEQRREVRSWAAEQGLTAPQRGRLPEALVTAWQEAKAG